MPQFKFFTDQQAESIRRAVKEAESRTSGEIRVYVETSCNEDVLDRAAWMFREMGMHRTESRTGVLLYVAVKSRKMAVIGDSGINAVVPADFWEETKERMLTDLREGRLCEGIVAGVLKIGDLLQEKFPHAEDDMNELPDDVVCGK